MCLYPNESCAGCIKVVFVTAFCKIVVFLSTRSVFWEYKRCHARLHIGKSAAVMSAWPIKVLAKRICNPKLCFDAKIKQRRLEQASFALLQPEFDWTIPAVWILSYLMYHTLFDTDPSWLQALNPSILFAWRAKIPPSQTVRALQQTPLQCSSQRFALSGRCWDREFFTAQHLFSPVFYFLYWFQLLFWFISMQALKNEWALNNVS